MQRLFTSFANGWPGKGLLIQRVLVGAIFVCCQFGDLSKATQFSVHLALLVTAIATLLLVVGLWTPIAGIVLALLESWMAISHTSDPLISAVLAVLGGTLAMIGPGAWSVDARLFGRKHIDISHP